MRVPIARHVDILLEEDDLPCDALARARRFLQCGDLTHLMELPLDPEEMIQVGRVLIQAPSSNYAATSGQCAPTLTTATRDRLRVIAETEGENAGAALFVLVQDLKARAFNHALAEIQ